MHYYTVLPIQQSKGYTYSSPLIFPIGTIVRIPFGSRVTTGVVTHRSEDPPHDLQLHLIKNIELAYEDPPLPHTTLKLIEWISSYYMYSPGKVLKLFLSGLSEPKYKARKKHGHFSFNAQIPREFPLTEEQTHAANTIIEALETRKTFLLKGVTGSGKTEVYYEVLQKIVAQHKQVLILLPEINLTQQWLDRFQKRFGVYPAIWHSSIKLSEKFHIWKEVINGRVPVVVGTRSALLLPFQNLGGIIVDEEHDASYKQEESLLYNARDTAIVRGTLEKCPVILASATPSLETVLNTENKKYTLLELTKRYGSAGDPDIHLIDLRKENLDKEHFISHTLLQKLNETLDRNEQAILFLNRRGFAPLTLCTSCGTKLKCPHCSTHLVSHSINQNHKNLCHHCGYQIPSIKHCPECNSENLRLWGVGIQRIYQELVEKMPNARILNVSSDDIQTTTDLDTLYKSIVNHEVDVLIGTQILAKGHDYPNITLIGIIDADGSLMNQDIRSAEQTYQLLYQVAGRCGRGSKKGHVYIQTYTPHHPTLQAICTLNQQQFLDLELHSREYANLPPFSRQASLLLSGKDEKKVKQLCAELLKAVPKADDITVLGPAPAILSKLRGQYRYRFLIQTSKKIKIQSFISDWILNIKPNFSVKISIDIDPYSLY